MSKPPGSFNGTENLIQNYCVTFSHSLKVGGNHSFRNSFVIKGAPVTKENALKVAEILFPKYTEIQIESIENDENTLTPSEYDFIQGVLKNRLSSRADASAERRKENPDIAKSWDENKNEKEYDEYLFMLIKKMQARMSQFPVYHT